MGALSVSGKNERVFKASSSGFGFKSLPESAVASVRLAGACEFGATANPAGPKRIANKSSHPTRGSGEFIFGFHGIVSLPQSDSLSVSRKNLQREWLNPIREPQHALLRSEHRYADFFLFFGR